MDRFDQATLSISSTADSTLLDVISKAREMLQSLDESTLDAYLQVWLTTNADSQCIALAFKACVVFMCPEGATLYTYTPVPENPLMPPKISSPTASFGAGDTTALVSMVQAVAQ